MKASALRPRSADDAVGVSPTPPLRAAESVAPFVDADDALRLLLTSQPPEVAPLRVEPRGLTYGRTPGEWRRLAAQRAVVTVDVR